MSPSIDIVNNTVLSSQKAAEPALSLKLQPQQLQAFLPIVEAKPLPTGRDAYEARRAELLADLSSKIPTSLRLPKAFFENVPVNVTKVPDTCGLLSDKEIAITNNYDATALVECLAKGQLSSAEVVTAFGKRAAIAHQVTACLVDFFLDEAVARAKELDEYLARTGTVVGPLHGLPISVKSHMPIAGHFSDAGHMSTIECSKEDCQMIAILRKLGAVFYVKTNQPQGLMHLETDSFLYRTLNPHNINLSSGGSTGGESALLAMRGSVLGIGTDIGGSIRGPAAFCGIWGYKPTSGVMPTKGYIAGDFLGGMNTPISTGPMALSLRDCDLFVRSVLSEKPHLVDPGLQFVRSWPVPQDLPKKLKVGIMHSDGLIQPQPPVVKAMSWFIDQLRSQPDRFEMIDSFLPYDPAKATALLREEGGYWPDAAGCVYEACKASGAPLHPLSESALSFAPKTPLSAKENAQYQAKLAEYCTAFSSSWTSQAVDVVVAPCFVGPASMHDTAFHWNYTCLWNAVDYPSLVFPTPITTATGDKYAEEHAQPLSEDCKVVRQLWEAGDFQGAPINLQLIARKNHDEELWRAIHAIDKLLLNKQ